MAERGYGWEKLMSEMFCQEYWAERGMKTFIARFHNVYGPYGTWDGGREKAPGRHLPQGDRGQGHRQAARSTSGATARRPAASCTSTTASQGIDMIMHCDDLIATPINLGSSELVSINDLVTWSRRSAGSSSKRRYELDAPRGVAGRNSDNTFIQKMLGWEPGTPLREGLADLRAGSRSSTATARPASDVANRSQLTALWTASHMRPRHRRAHRRIPYRMALAGGWIDQPFVSRLNPAPPGSMVVVGLEPTFRFMDRSGMATSTRKVAMRLWHGTAARAGDPAALVRELYAEENQRPGRAFRLAGHDRPDLPGRQPPRL